jgi:hypothetical protein
VPLASKMHELETEAQQMVVSAAWTVKAAASTRGLVPPQNATVALSVKAAKAVTASVAVLKHGPTVGAQRVEVGRLLTVGPAVAGIAVGVGPTVSNALGVGASVPVDTGPSVSGSGSAVGVGPAVGLGLDGAPMPPFPPPIPPPISPPFLAELIIRPIPRPIPMPIPIPVVTTGWGVRPNVGSGEKEKDGAGEKVAVGAGEKVAVGAGENVKVGDGENDADGARVLTLLFMPLPPLPPPPMPMPFVPMPMPISPLPLSAKTLFGIEDDLFLMGSASNLPTLGFALFPMALVPVDFTVVPDVALVFCLLVVSLAFVLTLRRNVDCTICSLVRHCTR